MGCRVRNTVLVKYGYYRDFYENAEELNKMLAERGLKTWRLFVPVSGVDNTVVSEVDFDSLGAMESEQEKFFSDADLMKTFRAAAEFVVEGSARTDVFLEAAQIA